MTNRHTTRESDQRQGFVLVTAVLMVLLISAIAGYSMIFARQHIHVARSWETYDQTLLDAQSGLERVKYELAQTYSGSGGVPSWFATWSPTTVGASPTYSLPAPFVVNQSTVTVALSSVLMPDQAGSTAAQVTLTARAHGSYRRCIEETVRFDAGGGSPAFDYVHMTDHGTTIGGGNLIINGNVRGNSNAVFSSTPRINGTVFASGAVSGGRNTWTLSQYFRSASLRAPPGSPTMTGGASWPMGYDPATATNCTQSAVLPFPVVGAITQYMALAASYDGRVSQGAAIVVSNIYSGAGPDGISGTVDDGCLILDGSTVPLRISGPVVVRGDVIIRGQVTGQGCIYAGRNIHIVGDLTYTNPPSWPKPDSTPDATATINRGKDLLVLVAKGNVVIGNYTSATWSNKVWSLMTAAATIVPCDSDPSDASIGYDSDNNPANGYRFDGRYYAVEAGGGRRLTGVGTNSTPRKYFESSLPYASVNAVSDPDLMTVDAVLFGNHGIVGLLGKTGKTTTLNGALVARDEYCNFSGTLMINWDIRMGSRSRDAVTPGYVLPSSVAGRAPLTITWREVPST